MKVIKRSKRDESRLVVGNIFFSILIIGLIAGIFLYILPNYNEINELKAQAYEENIKLVEYKKGGLNFEKLKELSQNSEFLNEDFEGKNHILSILNEMDETIYNKALKNTKELDYKTFIKKKIESYKNDKNNEDQLEKTSKILPLYDKSISEKGQITEFEFINYIESIMSTFSLTYKNSIGIKDIVYIEDYKLTNSDNSFDKGISQIPIELDIIGRKSSILDFLYFIQNVGNIELDNETGEININLPQNNGIFNFKNIKLDGDKNKDKDIESYNIFNNQIIDIENIEFKESIDSLNRDIRITESGNEFLKYIKETQNRDRFEIKIKINFYVKGLPKYKVDEFNNNFNKKLANIDTNLTRLLGITSLPGNDKQKLRNIKTSLDNIKSSTQEQSGEINENSLIQNFQNNALYMEILEGYENEINEINEKINKK